MFRTFILGVIMGLVATAGLLYAVPVVNLERERSIMTVNPNGGTQERFYANLPGDRIMASVNNGEQTWPQGLNWPDNPALGDVQTEVFKLRNDEDRVVAVASRVSSRAADPYVEWVVHMPARGSMYLVLDVEPDESGRRPGRLRGGSREFAMRTGVAAERFTAAGSSYNDSDGRLVLTTMLVGTELEDELVAEVSE